MFLSTFTLPVERERELIRAREIHNGGSQWGYVDNTYPCGLFTEKELSPIYFKKVTIFYGGNGSGKSTLLNLIATKLELNRIAPYNSSELFADYANACEYELGYDDEGFRWRIPNGSRIITSDDIFDYMLTVRTSNEYVAEGSESAREEWWKLRTEHVDLSTDNIIEDYEKIRAAMIAKTKSVSRRQFIRRTVGDQVKLNSNGETAFRYFEQRLKNDTLYCLDEPENSMSPKMQLELVKLLENMAHYCGNQFIIATHSPFLLALNGACIYDLDSDPVDVKKWWELENTRIYYEFFKKNASLFE